VTRTTPPDSLTSIPPEDPSPYVLVSLFSAQGLFAHLLFFPSFVGGLKFRLTPSPWCLCRVVRRHSRSRRFTVGSFRDPFLVNRTYLQVWTCCSVKVPLLADTHFLTASRCPSFSCPLCLIFFLVAFCAFRFLLARLLLGDLVLLRPLSCSYFSAALLF